MHMTKVISLSDEAYGELQKLKNKGESFSDVVIKLSKKEKKPLSDFFGKWPGPKEELDKMEREIEKSRKNFRL